MHQKIQSLNSLKYDYTNIFLFQNSKEKKVSQPGKEKEMDCKSSKTFYTTFVVCLECPINKIVQFLPFFNIFFRKGIRYKV